MSNRLFQGVIHQMKDAVDRVIGVIDDNGVIISCSELVKIGEIRQGIRDELAYTTDVVISGGYTYRSINAGDKAEYVVFVEGEDKMAERMSKLLSLVISKTFTTKNTIRAPLSKILFSIIFCPAIFISRAKNFILTQMRPVLFSL